MSTIYALASAPGRAGVSVIRMSGPEAFAAACEITGSNLPEHGRSLRKIYTLDGELIDEALVLTFAEGKSFTGEPIVEFQVHGSLAVVNALNARLASISSLRMAEAGEFTRRALLNDRLDLAQVEGLADLIDAETEAQRKQALRVFSGAVGEKVASWRKNLLHASALVTALIDFADEDLPESFTDEILASLEDLMSDLKKAVSGYHSAERIRTGYEVAIVGRPNAGKSTLLNYLAGREAAITSEYAGTTRDVIEVRMDLKGLPVTLLDTAGLRDDAGEIEAIGIKRALERAQAADFVVYLQENDADLPAEDLSVDLVIRGKADKGESGVGVSGITGQGVPEFTDMIVDNLKVRSQGAGVIVRQRHKLAVEAAIDHVDAVMTGLRDQNTPEEILAEDLRRASFELSSIVGDIDVEDVLGEIFSSFCIGK